MRSARRGAAAGRAAQRLSQLVRGELDWIVMKALEKDRDAAVRDGQRPGDGRAART